MKKKKLNISKREAYLVAFLFALGLIAAFLNIYANALTPGTAPNPGHSIQEISPPASCSSSQVLKFDGTKWYCDNDQVGGHGDGSNCPSGEYARGVDSQGNAQGCTPDKVGITSETDPKVGTLSTGKWCTSDGNQVICTANPPSGGVTSVNGISGAVSIVGQNGITVTTSGNQIIISYSGGATPTCITHPIGCTSDTFSCTSSCSAGESLISWSCAPGFPSESGNTGTCTASSSSSGYVSGSGTCQKCY